MAKNQKRRQQKLERRAAKRKEKHKLAARQQSAGIMDTLAACDKYPVLHCWITSTARTQGLGWAVLSRSLPNGTVAAAIFLIDRYCLGVKDAMVNITHRVTYDEQVVRKMI